MQDDNTPLPPKEIPLTRGRVALVDAEDYESLSRFKWAAKRSEYRPRHTWYAARWIPDPQHKRGRVQLYMQHAVLGSKQRIDHKNGGGLDNRKANLRPTTPSLNGFNTAKAVSNAGQPPTSRYKGVCWNKNHKKWVAQIGRHGKKILLGLFANEEAAARAYDKAALEFAGEFARLNFPKEGK